MTTDVEAEAASSTHFDIAQVEAEINVPEQEQKVAWAEFFALDTQQALQQKVDDCDGGPFRISFPEICNAQPTLAEAILANPTTVLGLAAKVLSGLVPSFRAPVYVHNLPATENVPLTLISAKHRNRLVAVVGQIGAIDAKTFLAQRACWTCKTCGNVMLVEPEGQILEAPIICDSCEKGIKFRRTPDQDRSVDQRIIILSEPAGEIRGGAPTELPIILTDQLATGVEGCRTVRITGKVVGRQQRVGQKESSNAEIVLLAHHMEVIDRDERPRDHKQTSVAWVAALANHPNALQEAIRHFAPHILGENLSKCYLLLSLIQAAPGNRRLNSNCFRTSIHVLLPGDRSTGKTQLLKYAGKIARRIRMASGAHATGVGLTAAAVDNPLRRGKLLHPGLAAQMTGGHLGIEELRDLPEGDQAKLKGVMEEQTIDFAKADKAGNLPALTSLLAAMNPPHGDAFDDHDTVADQLGMSPAMLSRWDGICPSRAQKDPTKFKAQVMSIGPQNDAESIDKLACLIDSRASISVDFPEQQIVERIADWLNSIRPYIRDGIDIRTRDSVIRTAMAHARLKGRSKVLDEDLDVAIRMKSESLFALAGEDPAVDVVMHAASQQGRMDLVLQTVRGSCATAEKGYVRDDVVVSRLAGRLSESLVHSVLTELHRTNVLYKKGGGGTSAPLTR